MRISSPLCTGLLVFACCVQPVEGMFFDILLRLLKLLCGLPFLDLLLPFCRECDCNPVEEFCEQDTGVCAEQGTIIKGECVQLPNTCSPLILDYVCGCDGTTYENNCKRQQAGVSKASDGACPESCGPCSAEEFCEQDTGVCAEQGTIIMGECVQLPNICSPLDPYYVCGCDGMTYNNDCERQQAGVSKASDGACQPCGTVTCSAEEFCEQDMGVCADVGTATGKCVLAPDDCDIAAHDDTVCGCNGISFGDDCFRRRARVSKASDGFCPGYCGFINAPPHNCDEDEFCEREAYACVGPATRECVQLPDTCDTEVDPVCGCDGTTYDNDCARQLAQVSKYSDGMCPEVTCGNATCNAVVEFCDQPTGICADPDQATGECALVPDNCGAAYDPVCGCDGTTFDNDCNRAKARVSKADNGKCCGGTVCLGDEFCENETSDCYDESDNGICVVVPDDCPENVNLVCGCDGTTFNNDCERQLARMSKFSDGPCPDRSCGDVACDVMEFCEQATGICADPGEATGGCIRISFSHICFTDWVPVCGCDGITYSNDCNRLAARVSKAGDVCCDGTVCL